MPTTSYVTPTLAVHAIASRTDEAGAAVTDLSAEEARLPSVLFTQGYILPADAFQVKPQAVPNMTVRVGSGVAKNDYYVVSGGGGGQGNYIVRLDVADVNLSVAPADPSQQRIDEVYLVVRDNIYDASARSLPQLGYRRGDVGAGPSGTPPGPDASWTAWALLSTITVPPAATTVTGSNLADNRVAATLPGVLNLEVANFFQRVFSSRTLDDAEPRFEIFADGYQRWGTGTAVGDTIMYRDAPGILRSGDQFWARVLAATELLGFTGGPNIAKVNSTRMSCNASLNVNGNLDLRAADSLFWGGDTSLYREFAGSVRTAGGFRANVVAADSTIGFVGGPNISRIDSGRMQVNSHLNLHGNLDLRSDDRVVWNGLVGIYNDPADGQRLSVDGSIGVTQASLFRGALNVNGGLYPNAGCFVTGSLSVSGAKNFRIPHPLDTSRYLVHSSTESPRAGVEYTGTATVTGGRAEVELPHYFEALVRGDGRTVHLTPVVDDAAEVVPVVGATRVADGKFRIVASPGAPAAFECHWLVKAVRGDIDEIEVEPVRDDDER